jgi:hypothetical protein
MDRRRLGTLVVRVSQAPQNAQLRRTSNHPNIVSCTSARETDYAAAPLGTFIRRNLPSHEFEAAHRVANLGFFGTQTH